jgi:ABC-type antimicrobial peptide transport system permease subunit
MTKALIGAALGVALAPALTRLLSSLLFEVAPGDPLVLVTATGIVIAAALIAGLVPALQATRVDPVVALREL